ncbi:YcjX family protein [Motilimonas pumila]|uniref:YcjX family protein n=1 Tax=Motilimonas pumila TaxID=2303987 RepID=A0A418YCA7_9GAMM|nr:YcjX family protein [Motilimonas pumila]RJG42161.1 YcjX family protein [Motilimonas pumila]
MAKHVLKQVKSGAKDILNRSLDRHVRLAVTGLSRAGKTAFITSLVDHLLQGPVQHQLPLWQVAREGRFLGAQRMPQVNFHVPSFDYDNAKKALKAPQPFWPESTQGVSEIRLKLKYQPKSVLWRNINHSAEMTLDIVDYPGEWLLDLPLLSLDYLSWSEQIVASLEQNGRAQLAQSWLNSGAQLDPFAPADEALLNDIVLQYTDYLHASKDTLGLHHIQPGRFVLPGELKGAPVLAFFPFVWLQNTPQEELKKAGKDSNFALLNARFEYYKKHVVKQFYQQHFVKFDRQIVLLDCLTPLNEGKQSFVDMQTAINQILQSFHYGRSSLMKRLFSPAIDKLVFAATKADHVTPDQHENLLTLMSNLVCEGQKQVAFSGIETHSLALAAVKTSQAGHVDFQGQAHPALTARQSSDGESVSLFPGEVPAHLPNDDFWQGQGFEFVDFLPPIQTSADSLTPLPHIRLDLALEHLLGDKLL